MTTSSIFHIIFLSCLVILISTEMTKDELKFFDETYKDLAPSASFNATYSSIVLLEATYNPDCPSQHGTINDV